MQAWFCNGSIDDIKQATLNNLVLNVQTGTSLT